MADKKSKEETIVDKFKEGFRTIKKELVQEDNPNSPHLVLSRMNAGILGSYDREESEEPKEKKKKHKKDKKEKKKKEKEVTKEPAKYPFGEEQFKRVVWGDDE